PHIRVAPHIVDVRHSLYFEAIDRDVPVGTVIKIGRFTDRVSHMANRIAFKSKVVSRAHAEVWTDDNSHFYIKDTKSSSGTFLNNVRLSPAGVESAPHLLRDGDILQLGMDFAGGREDMYKCVKIRIELNRKWQQTNENPFRRNVLQGIHRMAENHECCICLCNMRPFQALFVAPCSHMFHFKCIKPIIFTSTSFLCPLCRTYADLEANVAIDDD
ncbi:SMAD/FHA domain-containing protein, partial [Ramicandelaber brevisporus]